MQGCFQCLNKSKKQNATCSHYCSGNAKSCFLAQNNQQNMNDKLNTDETEILSVTRQLTELMIERNTGAMARIVDENFALTHITGYVQPKEEWFAEIERESMK